MRLWRNGGIYWVLAKQVTVLPSYNDSTKTCIIAVPQRLTEHRHKQKLYTQEALIAEGTVDFVINVVHCFLTMEVPHPKFQCWV